MTASSNWSITTFPTATSSSDMVKQAADKGAVEGTGILVLEQTAGRGRRGAVWKSAKGGMYLSLLLRPQFPVSQWFGLSFLAALAMRDVLATLIPDETLLLKWPNDILVGSAGGKICGILIEALADRLIIGTGVNIVPVESLEGAKQPAVALQDFGMDIKPEDLAKAYLDNLAQRYDSFGRTGFDPVRLEWLDHAAHIGKPVSAMFNGTTVTGNFEDLGQNGTMLLLDDSGIRHHISTGDVDLIGSL